MNNFNNNNFLSTYFHELFNKKTLHYKTASIFYSIKKIYFDFFDLINIIIIEY